MYRIKISDTKDGNGYLAVDLSSILKLLPDQGQGWQWKVGPVESYGGRLEIVERDRGPFERLADSGRRVQTGELVSIAKTKHQLIWAQVDAFESSDRHIPILQILAIDSSFFEVVTADVHLVSRLRARFSKVSVSDV